MAEQLPFQQENYPNQIAVVTENQLQPLQDNLIHVDFRPDIDRQTIMRRIGEVVSSWWLNEAGRGAITHEPIGVTESASGNISVRFKQYKAGFNGDELGIPNLEGWSGIETIQVLDLEWDASSHTIEPHYVHPRNFRYILPQHESRKRSASSRKNNSIITQELWGE